MRWGGVPLKKVVQDFVHQLSLGTRHTHAHTRADPNPQPRPQSRRKIGAAAPAGPQSGAGFRPSTVAPHARPNPNLLYRCQFSKHVSALLKYVALIISSISSCAPVPNTHMAHRNYGPGPSQALAGRVLLSKADGYFGARVGPIWDQV